VASDGRESVSPIIYILAIFAFLGSVILATMGGIGITTLPIDLIKVFMYRPVQITSAEYESRKSTIGERAAVLHENGEGIMEEMQGKKSGGWSDFGVGRDSRKLAGKENKFRAEVVELEVEFRHLEDGYRHQGGNFLVQITSLFLGFISYIRISLIKVLS
jgi:hypothetical protein